MPRPLRAVATRFQHHRAAPGLAGEDRPLEPERPDQRAKVGDRRVEVVAPLRSVGPAVAPLIDRDDRVTQRVEMRGDAVPESYIGRQSVHQHERRGGALGAVRCSAWRKTAR